MIRSNIIRVISRNSFLKKHYTILAKKLTMAGIRHPLSASKKSSEREWLEQNRTDVQRNPLLYVKVDSSVEAMFAYLEKWLHPGLKILEIGCNAGRNLEYLYRKGCTDLTGIEIGPEAKTVMKEYFPDLYENVKYIVGSALPEIQKLKSNHYDLVFTHGVLVNIHPKDNDLFRQMVRVSKLLVLIQESEGAFTAYPRDFKQIFEELGLSEIIKGHHGSSKIQLFSHKTRNGISCSAPSW